MACALVAPACSSKDYVAVVDPAAAPATTAGRSGGRDAGGPATGGACGGERIALRRMDGAREDVCRARLAAQTFAHALCACGDVVAASGLTTDAFDSGAGVGSDMLGAAVGSNGSLTASGGGEPSRIDGSVTLAGQASSQLAGEYAIGGDLRAAGDLALLGEILVQRDAWLRGVTIAGGDGALVIDRDLHVDPERGGVTVASSVTVGGEIAEHAFEIAPPCACAPEALIDVAATVTAAEVDNDAHGIDPAMFAALADETRARLPCGQFRLDAIAAPAGLELEIDAPVVLLVEGTVSGRLDVTLGPAGSLDLFVGGQLALSPASRLASADAPARTRIYAGGGDVVLGPRLEANVYAPGAAVLAPAAVEISGALFADRIVFGGAAAVHYDRALLAGLAQCGAASGAACEACGACEGGLACAGGTCGACVQDADCCAPLACSEGTCAPLAL